MGSALVQIGVLALLAVGGAGPSVTPGAALCEAAGQGAAERVRALLAEGVDVNARDVSGRTALVRGVEAASLPTVRALLEGGADVDASDRSGLTPLIAAALLGEADIADALLAAGADPDMRHRGYGTALDVAERAGRTALADLLRAHGARGSGHSTGDSVCVRPWDGAGYCGRILAIEGVRYRLRVTTLVGCTGGCEARPCSGERPVGGEARGRLDVGDELWVESACLTDVGCPTGVEPTRGTR